MAKTLDQLHFDNAFLRELPPDTEERNFRRQVKGACYSRVRPEPVSAPQLIAYSPEVLALLGLDEAVVEEESFAQIFSGNRLASGMDPYASCYGGHQFGNWAGQLGDGRAINLGEVLNDKGERFELQLKGAGPTPYSRQGDGRAVLRSSIREFLCSEAMHHLGVPTTRALSLVSTGDEILRDMFYDGNPRDEPGAVVCRVAPSFLRFGSFQIFAARDDQDTLKALADFAITHHFPHLGAPGPRAYQRFFEEVCASTADMIVEWMRTGFVHGVMNTDNMSILGLTIDYGPYGWLEDYDPNWTPNTTDAMGKRYAFARQPSVALWNLAQFGFALRSLFEEQDFLEEGLSLYQDRFQTNWRAMMAKKLGLSQLASEKDDELINGLFDTLQAAETDMTIFFRRLSDVAFHQQNEPETLSDEELIAPLTEAYYNEKQLEGVTAQLAQWLRLYGERLRDEQSSAEERRELMRRTNPKYVLRNYLAQLAIDKSEAGDHTLITELLDVMRRPYDDQPGREEFAEKRPEWARHRAGCSMLSCSS